VLKSEVVQVETCTDVFTMSHMAPFTLCNKIILGSS